MLQDYNIIMHNIALKIIEIKKYNNRRKMIMMKILLSIINNVRENNGMLPLESIAENMDLRADIGFDSLDLAELTVKIEKETGIDVFANSFVSTVGEILEKISK